MMISKIGTNSDILVPNKDIIVLNYDGNFFLPTSGKVLPSFQTFCPAGVQIAQMVVRSSQFQVQARKKGVFGWAGGRFVYVHIPKRSV